MFSNSFDMCTLTKLQILIGSHSKYKSAIQIRSIKDKLMQFNLFLISEMQTSICFPLITVPTHRPPPLNISLLEMMVFKATSFNIESLLDVVFKVFYLF